MLHISSIMTNLYAVCCVLQASLEFYRISLRNIIRNHMIRFTDWLQRRFIRSFGKFCSFRNSVCLWLILESKEINYTMVLRKRRCPRLHIGVGGVKREEGTFSYQLVLFLHYKGLLVSKIPLKAKVTDYSTVTFEFDRCALLPTRYRKRSTSELISIYFIKFH